MIMHHIQFKKVAYKLSWLFLGIIIIGSIFGFMYWDNIIEWLKFTIAEIIVYAIWHFILFMVTVHDWLEEIWEFLGNLKG